MIRNTQAMHSYIDTTLLPKSNVLNDINYSLLEAIRAAASLLEKEKQLTLEKRLSLIRALDELIIAGDQAYCLQKIAV